jgi:hypothetical protein
MWTFSIDISFGTWRECSLPCWFSGKFRVHMKYDRSADGSRSLKKSDCGGASYFPSYSLLYTTGLFSAVWILWFFMLSSRNSILGALSLAIHTILSGAIRDSQLLHLVLQIFAQSHISWILYWCLVCCLLVWSFLIFCQAVLCLLPTVTIILSFVLWCLL